MPIVAKGRVLAADARYVVFTTGDAVLLGSGVALPANVGLGSTVRVRIDPATRTIAGIERYAGPAAPGEIDISAIPRDIVAVDPRSARTADEVAAGATTGSAGSVTVTIDVAVPDVTPPTDDVYLSTERTNFSSAELRMNRIDALDWTISLPLASGSTLRYEFTRGSPSSVERQANGTIVTPRELTAAAALRTNDRVARWADKF
jgi:hypothetical protein